jgi:murein tripeptide amidase MpaA
MFQKLLRKLCVFIFCIAVLPQILQAQETEETIVARVRVRNFAEMMRVTQAGLDLMEYRDGEELIFWTTRKQFAELQKQNFVLRVDEQKTFELQRDLQPDTFRAGYRTVEETQAFLDQMQTRFPNLAQVFTYGKSWNLSRTDIGYELFGVELTNRQIAGSKPTFFLQAGIHARELVPPEIATRFIEYLLMNYGTDADATWLLDEHRIVVVPIVNPDGRKLAEQSLLKRKNANNTIGNCTNITFGIDLNRNFSFLWGTVNLPSEPPCGETFPGLTAGSEPETQAIQDLVDSLFPDQREPGRTEPAPLDATGVFLDMHSTGNLILYPWGQDNTPPPNLQLRTIARKMASYNGYNPIQSIDLYPTSGAAREYAYGERGVAGLGMEIGSGSGACGGFFPTYSCLDGGSGGNFWNLNRPALLYLAKIARTPYMTSEGATTETLTVSRTDTNSFALRAQISDANNGGQAVSTAEVYVDTPPWRGGTPVQMTAEDGAFNSTVEFAIINLTVSPGRHIFYVRGRDVTNNWGVIKAAFAPEPNADL